MSYALPPLPYEVRLARGGPGLVEDNSVSGVNLCDEAQAWLKQQNFTELNFDWDFETDRKGRVTGLLFWFAEKPPAFIFKLTWGGV